MRKEIPVLRADGSIAREYAHLLRQLKKEAAAHTLSANVYHGPSGYGSEAFYTLSDGTVLHEVHNEAARLVTLVKAPVRATRWRDMGRPASPPTH